MTYARRPHYPTVVARKFPGVHVSAQGNGEIYSMLQWSGTVIDEMTLSSARLEVYRDRVATRIREEADEQRALACTQILGTVDTQQLRTYDDKYAEAKAWTADNAVATPLMSAECAETGETLAVLAPAVIFEYEAAHTALSTTYGTIEGKRRTELSATSTMTMVELDAYPGPTW